MMDGGIKKVPDVLKEQDMMNKTILLFTFDKEFWGREQLLSFKRRYIF